MPQSTPALPLHFSGVVPSLAHTADSAVTFTVEVDFLGCGDWQLYDRYPVPARGYVHHAFPPGYSAHWLRVTASHACQASAYLTYT
jgi:hypothetical protein